MKLATAFLLYVSGVSTSRAAFVPRRRSILFSRNNGLLVENPRVALDAVTLHQENKTITDAWIEQELDDLDKDQFLVDMEREIAAVDTLSASPEPLFTALPEEKTGTEGSSLVDMLTIQSPYPSHDEAFQRLAMNAQEVAEKYHKELHQEHHVTVNVDSKGPTQAFFILGVAIAAVTFVDPAALMEQLGNLNLHGLDFSSIDFSALNLDGVAEDFVRLLEQMREYILAQASVLAQASSTIRADFLQHMDQLEQLVIAKASSIDMPDFASINMAGIKQEFVGRVKEIQDALQASDALQQLGVNMEVFKQDMAKGIQDTLQFSGINIQDMRDDAVKRMQDMFRADTWNIDVEGMKQGVLDSVKHMQESSSFALPQFTSINMEGVKQDFVNGMHDMLRGTETWSANMGRMQEDFVGRVQEMQDTFRAKSLTFTLPQFPAMKMEGMKEGFMSNIKGMQDAAISKSYSLSVPQLPTVNVEGMTEEFTGNMREMQEAVVAKSSSLSVPPLPTVNVEGMTQDMLGQVKEMADKASSVDFSSLDIENIKGSLPKVSTIDLPQFPSVDMEGMKESLLAKTASVELPSLNLDGLKENFLTNLPQFPSLNTDGFKEDFVRHMEDLKQTFQVKTFMDNHDGMVDDIFHVKNFVNIHEGVTEHASIKSLIDKHDGLIENFHGGMKGVRDVILDKASTVNLPQFNIEGMTSDLLGRMEEMQDVVRAKSSSVSVPQFSVDIEGMKQDVLGSMPKFEAPVGNPSVVVDSLNELQDTIADKASSVSLLEPPSTLDLSKFGSAEQIHDFLHS